MTSYAVEKKIKFFAVVFSLVKCSRKSAFCIRACARARERERERISKFEYTYEREHPACACAQFCARAHRMCLCSEAVLALKTVLALKYCACAQG